MTLGTHATHGSDADKLRNALRFFMNALHRLKVLDAATGTTDAAQVSCAPYIPLNLFF